MNINLYQEYFKGMQIRYIYHFITQGKYISKELHIGLCIVCNVETIVPFDICHGCMTTIGLEIINEYDGFGVKTLIPRKKNEIVKKLRYLGDIITKTELDTLYGDTFAPYSIKYVGNLVLDASVKRCVLSLINASHNPNAIFVVKNLEICLQFIRPIQAGEVIYIDYDYSGNYTHSTKQN